jgi:L-threonylcarbamoyladenylate synthase
MSTPVWSISADAPDAEMIRRAAELLRAGKLVAFPTETVYGLGANALDERAVRRIFEAKGRPAANPLIVHVPDVAGARRLVAQWPPAAHKLADRFWPGPISLVLPKRPLVPEIVTGGGPTIALRVPAHPVALALLRAAEVPLAAPSANRSLRVSPTRAEHVLTTLQGRIDLVLDAGPTPGGLESTVVDLSVSPPRVLRLGLILPDEIADLLGQPVEHAHPPGGHPGPAAGEPYRSPGQMRKHYAPLTPVECLVEGDGQAVGAFCEQYRRVGVLCFGTPPPPLPDNAVIRVLPAEPELAARQLYAALYQLDSSAVDRILIQLPPPTPQWVAVRDRLLRAAAQE